MRGAESARRGSTATYVAVTLPILGMFAALAVEVFYLRVVHQELQGVADAAAHAAMLEVDGTQSGLDAARASAVAVASGMAVNGRPYVLSGGQVTFGDWDPETSTFTPTQDPELVDAVRVPLVESPVGLGLGRAFFGGTFSASACAAATRGPGNANTGELGGPGVANGHFDYDTRGDHATISTASEGRQRDRVRADRARARALHVRARRLRLALHGRPAGEVRRPGRRARRRADRPGRQPRRGRDPCGVAEQVAIDRLAAWPVSDMAVAADAVLLGNSRIVLRVTVTFEPLVGFVPLPASYVVTVEKVLEQV